MKPIYEPKGKAKEYGDLAINIYTGCPHNCFYCFAPNVLHKDRKTFHSEVKPRENIVEAVKKQLKDENISEKLIHLCFTCDPYPTGYDTTPTREIIKAIKDSGNNVQILTKGDGSRDFDLLGPEDWYGITLDGATTRTGHFDNAPPFQIHQSHKGTRKRHKDLGIIRACAERRKCTRNDKGHSTTRRQGKNRQAKLS